VQVMPALLGAGGGAVALLLVGFSWGGWVTGAGSEEVAKDRAGTAVIAALTPLCVAKVQASMDLALHLFQLNRMNSWERGPYIEREGWATTPGGRVASTALARACAQHLDHHFVPGKSAP
jgi:hypothetical protein